MEFRPLVVDQGSGMMKVGFAGDDIPLLLMPTTLALETESVKSNISKTSPTEIGIKKKSIGEENKEKVKDTPLSNREDNYLVGDDAMGVDRSSGAISRSARYFSLNSNNIKNYNDKIDNRNFKSLLFPIERGIVDDWDAMERIYEAIFSHPKIGTSPENQPLLISEPCENPKENRYKMAEILFEKFKIPSLYVATQPVLSLYASGKTSGLVVEVGHSVTQTVPIYEGFPLYHAIARYNFGGQDLTFYLQHLLEDNKKSIDCDFNSIRGYKVLTEIKEKLCYVAMDPEEEIGSVKYKEYVLPDRKVIKVSDETFQCPEALFKPALMGREGIPGIHEAIFHVYEKSDDFIKQILLDNVILAGGSTMFRGMKERLSKQFLRYAEEKSNGKIEKLNLRAENDRIFSCWIGGSIFASLPTVQQHWISKQDYDEQHDSIFSRCYG